MFKTFNTSAIQDVLSLYDSSCTTGEGVSHGGPVYKGPALPHATWLAASTPTTSCRYPLRGTTPSPAPPRGKSSMTVKLCYVAWDFKQEMFTATGSTLLKESYKLSVS